VFDGGEEYLAVTRCYTRLIPLLISQVSRRAESEILEKLLDIDCTPDFDDEHGVVKNAVLNFVLGHPYSSDLAGCRKTKAKTILDFLDELSAYYRRTEQKVKSWSDDHELWSKVYPTFESDLESLKGNLKPNKDEKLTGKGVGMMETLLSRTKRLVSDCRGDIQRLFRTKTIKKYGVHKSLTETGINILHSILNKYVDHQVTYMTLILNQKMSLLQHFMRLVRTDEEKGRIFLDDIDTTSSFNESFVDPHRISSNVNKNVQSEKDDSMSNNAES
jgi:hypothetical protein